MLTPLNIASPSKNARKFAKVDRVLQQNTAKIERAGDFPGTAGHLCRQMQDFDNFKKEFLELCRQYQIEETAKPNINISLSEITMTNYELIRSFAPFGMGFEEPLFSIENIPTKGLVFISEGKHLSTPLTIQSKLLGFNMPKSDVQSKVLMDIEGHFNLSSYRGAKTLEFRISKYNLHHKSAPVR